MAVSQHDVIDTLNSHQMREALHFMVNVAEGMEDAPLWRYVKDALTMATGGADAVLNDNGIARTDDGTPIVLPSNTPEFDKLAKSGTYGKAVND